MRFISALAFALSVLLSTSACCSVDNSWNKKRAAIALTYDDALNTHIDYVAPALEDKGLRGTFYVTTSFPAFESRIEDWRAMAHRGHELGNHTLFHPCTGGKGREWVNPENDLNTWSEARFIANYKTVNTLLHAVDGKTQRTLAYPCGDQTVGPSKKSYVEAIKDLVPGARSAYGSPQTKKQAQGHLYAISATMIHQQTGEELIQMVDDAIENGTLMVFLFHGVGGEHNLNVSKQAHAQLLDYLQKKKDQLWIAPMIDIIEYLKDSKHKEPPLKP